ncbi:hypothetical protein Y032_0002g988 [Ancylostoma ceylanicum]|uniref:Uncharacterized protein n=1 Tax=Ancylostoma ceylanicum TaxID=53326 RepID=A0A016W2A5_9BILA|nr:hypothetical protein Y032_0002g988 [Ancylostoma ceylanicum]
MFLFRDKSSLYQMRALAVRLTLASICRGFSMKTSQRGRLTIAGNTAVEDAERSLLLVHIELSPSFCPYSTPLPLNPHRCVDLRRLVAFSATFHSLYRAAEGQSVTRPPPQSHYGRESQRLWGYRRGFIDVKKYISNISRQSKRRGIYYFVFYGIGYV